MKTKAEALGALFGTLLSAFVFAPLLLICGLNWLLEAAGHSQLPYSWASWFGACLVASAFRNLPGNQR